MGGETVNLYIAKKAFSLFGKYDVTDGQGNILYKVAEQPSLTDKLIVTDAKGREAGEIHRKVITTTGAWVLYDHGTYIGELHDHHELFKEELAVTRLDWHIAGTFRGWNYQIKKGPFTVIATVSSQMFHATQHYVIDVEDRALALPSLLVSLAVSLYSTPDKQN